MVACDRSAPPTEEEGPPPPNVLLIVVDTLRADRLSIYGHDRETSPQMKTHIAERGVLMEHAYAQAPWTIPSMASMMTGLDPAVFLDDQGKPWGLPEAAQTLAESLSAAGYDTRAFVANPTLHEGNGFAQGFDHFETAPYDVASLSLHADDLDSRVRPHLNDLREPFFLYTHYLDPHDPYDNPEIEEGLSPFFPEYRGNLRGTDVHGLYLRKLKMAHPEQDVEHLRALYDSEIHYVDRYIGELLSTLAPEVLKRTLVVLTSDHGEELFDHGGWKHGESVYEEQIRVPLVFRWGDRLPAGLRLDQTVRLLDIHPTVLEAAGLLDSKQAERLHGRSLLPALMGKPLGDVPAFSRHHADGPLRAAKVDGRHKTILFDREALLEPGSERIKTFQELDRGRMQRLEIYDLATDPKELTNLANRFSGAARGREVIAELDPYVSGLRIFTSGLGAGRVAGRIDFAHQPSKVHRWFLGTDDRVEVQKKSVSFTFLGDGIEKGISLEGPIGEITGFQLEPVATSTAVRWAGQLTMPSFPAGLRAVLSGTLPEYVGPGPELHIWIRESKPKIGDGHRDAETLKRLKALGYAD